MITEAHVGIGIKGHEGQQASRSADFAIGEFKLLKRLIFFHGREYYRRNSNLMMYCFYKNFLINMPNLYFGWQSYYSGSRLYDEFGYQLYNLVFTSLPAGFYAGFERESSDTVLMRDPVLYQIGPKRILYNTKRFLYVFFWSSLQAYLVYRFA